MIALAAPHPGFSGVSLNEDEVKPVTQRAERPEDRYAAGTSGVGSASTVPVLSLWPTVLIIDGNPSGAVYRWDRGGTVVQVAAEDVEYLGSFNLHGNERACCGGGPRTYFQFADGG